MQPLILNTDAHTNMNSIQGKLFGTLIFQHLICFDSMHQAERNYVKKYCVEKEEKKTNRN